ncbi:hypothetical protein NG99_07090 [Erwinia typographi]|uniref:Uncharacterized protein n=1 Tax=Erwinia typographi TaxID=371042 RepID=A0A0A3Z7A5_9GAMM|nr:hypothetical protein NG99_07090 [Erwinia typographi]
MELVLKKIYRNQKRENPDNLSKFADSRRLTGHHIICIEAVALCGEYRFMLRKRQYLLCLLLLRDISAGRSG